MLRKQFFPQLLGYFTEQAELQTQKTASAPEQY
jgi:hypothetical protein